MRQILQSLPEEGSGTAAIEYGPIAALIAVGAVAAITSVAHNLKTVCSAVASNANT